MAKDADLGRLDELRAAAEASGTGETRCAVQAEARGDRAPCVLGR
jgi:hypothetical protein